MIFRIHLVERLDGLHRIPHQIILLPEDLIQIYLAAATAVSSRKEKNGLLLSLLKYHLQDIRIISVLIYSCVDRYFAGLRCQMFLQFLPPLAAGRFLE